MAPLHPAVVHFPIALMTFALVADLFSRLRNRYYPSRIGLAALLGTVIGGVVAVAAGYYDMRHAALGETHEFVHFHMYVGWILLVALTGLALWRWQISRQPKPRLGPLYMASTVVTLGLALFQGWYGGELVYSQGAGVAAAGKGTEPPSAGLHRLSVVTNKLGCDTHADEDTHDEAHE